MDISMDKKLTVRLPKNLRKKLDNVATELDITTISYVKISLYTAMNLSPFKFKSDMKVDNIISEIPSEKDGRINLPISNKLNELLRKNAKKYDVYVSELILAIIIISLKNYDNDKEIIN